MAAPGNLLTIKEVCTRLKIGRTTFDLKFRQRIRRVCWGKQRFLYYESDVEKLWSELYEKGFV